MKYMESEMWKIVITEEFLVYGRMSVEIEHAKTNHTQELYIFSSSAERRQVS